MSSTLTPQIPVEVWLVEGQGFPGGRQFNEARVYSDQGSAEGAAYAGARARASVYLVTRCSLGGRGIAAHQPVLRVDSAARWGQILAPGGSLFEVDRLEGP
jgi:hypothetical protein